MKCAIYHVALSTDSLFVMIGSYLVGKPVTFYYRAPWPGPQFSFVIIHFKWTRVGVISLLEGLGLTLIDISNQSGKKLLCTISITHFERLKLQIIRCVNM